MNFVDGADIDYGYRSDHSIITTKLVFKQDTNRKSFWKFNTSLLKDSEYLEEVNTLIEEVISEYAAAPYNRDGLSGVPKSEIVFTLAEDTFLDFLLMKIRAKTIAYATMKKKKNIEEEKNLEDSIQTLEKKANKSTEEYNEILEKQEELEKLRQKRLEGVLLRSRARWIAEGEKVSKYFCNLEKRHYVSKTMSHIREDGIVITDSLEIANKVNSFYQKLYEKKEVENCGIRELVSEVPHLNERDMKELEGEITYEEASNVLKNMNNSKSPGSDGFSAEFFKVFWVKLGHLVVRALNASFRKGILTPTQREGVIVCIPKGDKDRELIKNWRPISLLNVVYKIGSGSIASRLKDVLPNLINDDQTGFIRGRFIGDNIRLIYDMIEYLNRKELPGLLLNLDFEKAFDSISWDFMLNVLKEFGFGDDLCKWIKLFYTDIKSTVSVNGITAGWFKVGRGCRQGDPISPYLFVLCVEILAIMIRENNDIKGIEINNTEHKISQYADDTELTLEGDRKSFETCIQVIDRFGKVSGLNLSTEKCEAMWLGSQKNSNVTYMQHLGMKWNPPKMKILGIWFTNSLEECENLNYTEKFYEVRKLFSTWSKRNITPLGRVAVLKSLILSKLIYLWILLPNPPTHLMKDLQTRCFTFVWNKKTDRISRKTSVKKCSDGGIGIPDINTMIMALKLSWIRKFEKTNHKWKNILIENCKYVTQIDKYGPNIFLRNKIENLFWTQVLQSYKVYFYTIKPCNEGELLAEPICYNERIKIGYSIIKKTTWEEHDVAKIADFLKINGNIMDYNEFIEKHNIHIDFITYTGIKMAILQYIKDSKIVVTNNLPSRVTAALRKIYSIQKGSKLYYDALMANDVKPNCCSKWNTKLAKNVNWKDCFYKVQKISDIALKWLQIRIVHRIIATNVMLKEMGVAQTDKCSFCKNERESIQHTFWLCQHVHNFWEKLENAFNERCNNVHNLRLTESLVLLGTDQNIKTDSVFYFIILLAKQYVYRCKYKEVVPNLDVFMKLLKNRFRIEQYNARINSKYASLVSSWASYKPLFQENC